MSTSVLKALPGKLDIKRHSPSILYLPNRLASSVLQSQRHLVALGDYMGANCHALVGGTTVRDDVRILQDGRVHVVAGTPGRVNHMIKNNSLGKL